MAGKKINILHYGISAHLGGIETYSYKLARYFEGDEYHLDFLYLGKKKPCFYEEISALGCGFIGITSRRENYFQYLKELDELFKKRKWDVVHLHLNSLNNISPVMAALKYRNKVIIHSRNGGDQLNFAKHIIHEINFWRLSRCTLKRLAVSDLAGQWMFGKDADFTVINNGVDLKKFYYTEAGRNKVRNEFDLGDKPVVVHTGSFKKQKNHDFLIDIFDQLVKLNPDYRLLLVGTGELMSETKNNVEKLGLKEKVVFLGQRNDIPDVLCAGDYFLFPSFYEGFPNALIEAEACGLSCLVADTITDNVVFDEICRKQSLDSSANIWANELNVMQPFDRREYAVRIVVEKSLDVESEIKSLSHIYVEVMR